MLNSSALDSTLEQLHGHLEEYLKSQGVKIDPANKKFSCINPEHKDSTPSSAIVPDSNGAVFHCFGCGVSGDIFHAAAFIEGLPRSGPGFLNSTIKVLCQRFNVPIPDIELTPEQRELHDGLLAVQAEIMSRLHGDASVAFLMTTIRRQAASSHLKSLLAGFLVRTCRGSSRLCAKHKLL